MNKFLDSKFVKIIISKGFDLITSGMITIGIMTTFLMGVSALLAEKPTPVGAVLIIKVSVVIAIIGGILNYSRFLLKRYIYSTEQKQQDNENLQRNILRQREREELELKRQYVDLILEKVDDKYRLKLVRGDNTIEYLTYISGKYDFPDIYKPPTAFRFFDEQRTKGYVTLFPECALFNLKNIVEHYQKYGNLDAVPPVIQQVERFVISRPEVEPPPDLTGIDTVHELVPLLVEAERQNDDYAVNKVLDKMERIKTLQIS